MADFYQISHEIIISHLLLNYENKLFNFRMLVYL